MEIKKLDIFPCRKKYFNTLQGQIKKSVISDRNKELIRQFQDYYFSTGTGELRLAKLCKQILTICEWLLDLGVDKDLDTLKKADALSLVAFINRLENRKENTKADYRRCVRQFYNWYKEEDERVYSHDEKESTDAKKLYNFVQKEMKINYKLNQADPNTIISDNDARKVIEYGCETAREKAIIACLHEWGTRASEFLNLRVGILCLRRIMQKYTFLMERLGEGLFILHSRLVILLNG